MGFKPSERPTGFLQCFDTVGLVIYRPVKIVRDMTYNVFGGTLNLVQSILRLLSVLMQTSRLESNFRDFPNDWFTRDNVE